jgi:predicted SAM-dependent methyltransferase
MGLRRWLMLYRGFGAPDVHKTTMSYPALPAFSRKIGEVDKIRKTVSLHLTGDGLDIGFGGNPINNTAICIDLAEPYSDRGYPRHLSGDGRSLRWFKDGSLDYVFSSHMLEDYINTEEIIVEWLRVLKPGGKLALYLPDEQRYQIVMQKTGGSYNQHHQIADMSPGYIRGILFKLNVRVVYQYVETEELSYGFLMVGKKDGGNVE